MNRLTPQASRDRHHAGFTLVEVMISIAIALVLILGISQIFSLAQRTTGAGNAVIATVESMRGAQATFSQDFSGIANGVGDSPGIIIVSYAVPAFRSLQDQQQDRDGLASTLNDPAGPNSLAAMNFSQVNDRVHRVDKIYFFTRGRYARQTSSGTNLTSATTGSEALIAIGHAALPNSQELKTWNPNAPQSATGQAAYFNPGARNGGTAINDNNAFAADWALARNVILLSPASPPIDAAGTYQPNTADALSSLAPAAMSSGRIPIYSSRFDIAQTSISNYRTYVSSQIANNVSGTPHWWQTVSGISLSWTDETSRTTVRPRNITGDVRFEVNPFVIKPASTTGVNAARRQLSAAVAQASPVMIRGCTQFIVEFAGDFVTQDANGLVGTTDSYGNTTSGGPDGQIDFTVDPNTGIRSVRWYGFPRDPNDERSIGVLTANKGAYQYGVCPLRDTIQIATPGSSSLIERCIPQKTTINTAGTGRGYSAANFAGMRITANGTASQAYVTAWDPFTDGKQVPRPKMIRITLAVDDPAGHLNTQQVYQYVFNLP